MNSLQSFKDNMARSLYGETAAEAIDSGLCISCKQQALPRCYSDAGKAEYRISGLCEPCFDAACGEEE